MTRKNTPKIPRKAKIRILRELRNKHRVPTERMLKIISRQNEADMSDRIVRSFWLSRCQQLMAKIRDDDGKRLVFNVPKRKSVNGVSEYIIVAACENPCELAAISHRMSKDVAGLENSIAVVDSQIASITCIRASIDRIISKLGEDEDGE